MTSRANPCQQMPKIRNIKDTMPGISETSVMPQVFNEYAGFRILKPPLAEGHAASIEVQ
jgi:hypothetical protein